MLSISAGRNILALTDADCTLHSLAGSGCRRKIRASDFSARATSVGDAATTSRSLHSLVMPSRRRPREISSPDGARVFRATRNRRSFEGHQRTPNGDHRPDERQGRMIDVSRCPWKRTFIRTTVTSVSCQRTAARCRLKIREAVADASIVAAKNPRRRAPSAAAGGCAGSGCSMAWAPADRLRAQS
jgi:hypothetical protein